MAKEKIIAVVGATGAQGSGLCRAILNDRNGGYRVRALTRKSGSDMAKELKKKGEEEGKKKKKRGRGGGRGGGRRGEEPGTGVPGPPRGVLRHLLLGALFAREGVCACQRHGPCGKACRRESRHLVDPRKHPQMGSCKRR